MNDINQDSRPKTLTFSNLWTEDRTRHARGPVQFIRDIYTNKRNIKLTGFKTGYNFEVSQLELEMEPWPLVLDQLFVSTNIFE